MNLHQQTAIPPSPPIDLRACPRCNGIRFVRTETGMYSEDNKIWLDGDHPMVEADDDSHDASDFTPWTCRDCGHELDEDNDPELELADHLSMVWWRGG